jgi:mannose-1-phosphate guanylyltransferase
VTFGIVPDLAHTGYGYIRRREALASDSTGYAVAELVEKPDLATA